MRAMRLYLLVAAICLGATLALAIGAAVGRIISDCPADRCIRFDGQ